MFERFKKPTHNFSGKPKPIRRIRKSKSRAEIVLKEMSNRKRLEILTHLLDGEELSVEELRQVLQNLSQSALSQHLARLRRAKILKSRRASQKVYYSFEDGEVERIMDLLRDIYPDDPSLPTDSVN